MTSNVKAAMIPCRRIQSAQTPTAQAHSGLGFVVSRPPAGDQQGGQGPGHNRAALLTCPEVVAMPSTGSTAARGYGQAHEKQRRAWAPKVRRGQVDCARCGLRIGPNEQWDMGHTEDRSAWSGPEHQGCNRRAGAANSHAVRKGLKHSRAW